MNPSGNPPPKILAELVRTRERMAALELEANQRERRLLDRMAEGFLAANLEGNVRQANAAAAEMLGGDPAGIAGQSLSDLLGPHLAANILAAARSEPEGAEARFSGKPPNADRTLYSRSFRDTDGLSIFLAAEFRGASAGAVKGGEPVPEGEALPYRALLETLPVVVIIHDNFQIRFINPAGAEILGGGDPAEFLGRNVLELVHPDSLPVVKERIRNLGAGRINQLADIQVRIADGSRRTVQAVSAPFSHRGHPSVLLMAVDITARKAAEEELAAIFDNSQVGLVLLRNGRIVNRCNRRFAEILRYEDPDALRGLGVGRFHLSDEHFVEFGRLHYQTLRRGAQLQVEYPLRRKDGSPVWCSLSGKALDDGTPPDLDHGVLWVVGDITRRKAAERTIRDSEERYRTLATHSPTGILLSDGETIRFANAAAARLLGADRPEDLMGRSLFDRLHPDFHPMARRRIQAMQDKGQPVPPAEQRYLRLDGTSFPVEVVAVPLDLAEGRRIYSLFQDITERKAAEKALRASLLEKEVLLREIHHRVKNNMAVIAGLLDMQLGQVSAPEVRRLLQDSRGRIGAMSIIHETLYRSENLAAVPLENYLNRLTAQLFSLYAPPMGAVTVRIDAPGIHLPAQQAVHVGLAATELVTNALKYAFPDGRKGTLSIQGTHRPGGWIDLRVRDDGVGFPPGFDPETATSLGMRLVSLLVNRQLHGRWHWVEDGGISFHLSWPVVAPGSGRR